MLISPQLRQWVYSSIMRSRSRRRQRRDMASRFLALRKLGYPEILEDRTLLASDFGDAPDTRAGTASGDYQTIATNGGPSHTVVAGLFLGANVDGDDGTLQNLRANADDVDGALPDDEDGVLSPGTDLIGTIGAAPTVTLLATNTTGSSATLSGWIDYNNDGVFDNATERAQIAVPNSTTGGRFTLTFPTIPGGFTGTTYARFRLSTDTAASNSTGAAANGEVEDYVFAITSPGTGNVKQTVEINGSTINGPVLGDGDWFGHSVTSLGDLDGDGVSDLAVGAIFDDEGGSNRGAVHILLLNENGSVKQTVEINSSTPNGPAVSSYDFFGSSVTSLGDLDGDGVIDLAIGATGDDEGGNGHGAVHILLLNGNGSVKQSAEINSSTLNGPVLEPFDAFGRSVTSLGDLDGDGVTDLAVGAYRDDAGGNARGAVHVLLLNANGSVKQTVEINSSTPNGPALSNGDNFGLSVAALGDLDGDGVTDLAVGAFRGSDGGGALHILFLNANGSVKQSAEINSSTPNGPVPNGSGLFGFSVTSLGDLDGDGVTDLAVGAVGDASGGALYVLLLNANASVKQTFEINSSTPNGPALSTFDRFGISVASLGDLDGDGVTDLAVGARQDDAGGTDRGAIHILSLAPPLLDFGDLPDATAGTETGNYETIAANGGPSHTIAAGLFLGANVDGDDGTLQNPQANADDVDGALPDDEDGVLSPATDLIGTIGAAPTVTLLATNTTGSSATLSGWIDYNNNGVFDNSTERAQIAVPGDSTDDRFTLTFPTIPEGFTGTTYARFRLSTDAAAGNSTGAAVGGEVEDYVFAITSPNTGNVKQTVEINGNTPNGPLLTSSDQFGSSVTPLGDLDGDGITDLAIGASGDDSFRGAVHVVLLNSNGSVKQTVEINSSTLNGPVLEPFDSFGRSMTSLGDLDGDGVTDLAVGADGDDEGGSGRGAVHILLLNANGSVKQTVEINNDTPNGPVLNDGDQFGLSVTSLGDLDGDGVPDLAVGAPSDDQESNGIGAVHILLLNPNGSVKQTVEINNSTPNGPALSTFDLFGSSVTSLGDLDGDGVTDLAVGARSGSYGGALHILFLNVDGSVKQSAEINSSTSNGPALEFFDNFGSSVTSPGDLDGDGLPDLAVGAPDDIEGGSRRGAVHVLLLNADGSVKQTVEINSSTTNGPVLSNDDYFGSSVTSLGDLDGDGVVDLAIGATGDDEGGSQLGTVHVLSLAPPSPPVDYGDAPDAVAGTGPDNYETTVASGGPSHTIVAGLHLGANVDGDEGALQNSRANADDVDGALDDEDGVLSPGTDLIGTIGAAPTVTLLATNTTGSSATLSGWIDYNNDGVFDNATELAQIAVLNTTINGRFTLTFPTIPQGFTGKTYSRFRLSTDLAAGNSTGAAVGGEVEDYVFAITSPGTGNVKQTVEINGTTLNIPTLSSIDGFGSSVTTLGDLDGDGITDLAVGASGDDDGGTNRGAVHVLLLNANGSVKQSTEINSSTPNGPTLGEDKFGSSVTSLGDLDGDGVTDLAVGAILNDEGVYLDRGAVHVLFLNANGLVRRSAEINSSTLNGPVLNVGDHFGSSVSSLGDLDGDGVADLAVGASGDNEGGANRGAVHVLLLNSNGSVKQTVEINSSTANGPALSNGDGFGDSMTSLGDLDGDGVTDLAVGAIGDDEGGSERGAVHVLLLNANGSVKQTVEINSSTPNGPILDNFDGFGSSVTSLSDLDGDGVADIAVGAFRDDNSGSSRGAVHVLLLNANGSVKQTVEINGSTLNGPVLDVGDLFGNSVTTLGDLDGDGVIDLAVGATGNDEGGSRQGAVHILSLAPPSPSVDYGDAPDAVAGTGIGNYETIAASGGPSHTIVAGLHLGANVDGDDGTLQNSRANADDVDGALPDDEDGVLSPGTDLIGTIGAAPTVTLLATNTTGNSATLSGWIDYNGDGVFDNATERAQNAVPDSTTGGRFTLTFPTIPEGFTGTTYARFRLSTDLAAGNSTGAAVGGEVEDYVFAITSPGTGNVKQTVEINGSTINGPALSNNDRFGNSVTPLGDLDGDGITDLAVGAYGDDEGGTDRGAVHVLLLNANGSVKQTVEINSSTANGPLLANADQFGRSVTSLSDLDGDGVADIAVGAFLDDDGGTDRGAVHLLLLNPNGSVKQTVEINSSTLNGPVLSDFDYFGSSVTSLGDLDGDGIIDIAVGAYGDDEGGTNRGAVHVLLLNANGSVKQTVKINSSTTNGPVLDDVDRFGVSVTSLGDLDGDGAADLAVGASLDDDGGTNRGAVHILLLNANGSVKQTVEINSSTLNGPVQSNSDLFGRSVTSLGDLDGDGVTDLAVGGARDDEGGTDRGAVHVLLLNANGSVKQTMEINNSSISGPALDDLDRFGSSVASLGDLDGDGVTDLAVGAIYDDTGGTNRGAVHMLFLSPPDTTPPTVSVSLDDPALKAGETATVTFTFSEIPVGFTADDVTVENGTLSAFDATADPLVYSATFTPTPAIEAATNVIGVGAGYTDAAGNTGTPGVSANYTIDTLNPTVSVNIVDTSLHDGDSASQVTFEFSEDVVGFTTADVSVSNGTISEFTIVDGNSFTAVFAAADGIDANGSISVGAASYTDIAGNDGGTGTDTATIDTLNPTVVISPDGTTTTALSIVFTFQFSEAVSGFVAGDVNLTNGSAGTFTPVNADTFTLEVIPASPGAVTVSVAAGVAQDAAGNFNASASASVTSSAAGAVTLPGGGTYEVLINGGDLVVRIAGGAEQFRRSVASVSVLEIAGSAGADVIKILSSGGTVATPILFTGGQGADQFDASLVTGATTLIGGSGNDTLAGGFDDDFIIGGSGSDVVTGGPGDDLLFGNGGNDSLNGGSGNDIINGGNGRDSIDGGQNADVLSGGRGPDTIVGGEGDDRIRGGGGRDLLDGDDGEDTLIGGPGPDNLAGGLGNDTLNGIFRDDTFNQVVGRDTLIGGQRPAPRPAPVIPFDPESEPESSLFLSPPPESETAEEIDTAFLPTLFPALLEI